MSCAAERLAVTLSTTTRRPVDANFNVFDVLAILPDQRRVGVLRGCGCTADMLASRGATTLGLFRKLGYDALDLVVDHQFGVDLVARFGVDVVRDMFVAHAGDAVAVAGEQIQETLKATPETLLGLCRGNAEAAHAVLDQLLMQYHERCRNNSIRPASPFELTTVETLVASDVRLDMLEQMRLDLWGHIDGTVEQRTALGWRPLALGRS
jgi:hypothetical protein